MANKKAKKDNKSLIAIICGVVAVVVVVVVIAVALATSGGNTLNDNYFKSDDTKYVLTLETDTETLEEDSDSYTPVKTHYVYNYEGDAITGHKVYFEYADADTAKAAFDAIVEVGEDTSAMEVTSKYIIITAAPEDYEGLTASDVKQQIEFIEMVQSGEIDYTTGDDGEAETVEDTEE